MARVKCVAAAMRTGQSADGAVHLHDVTLQVLGEGAADAPFVEGQEYDVLLPEASPEAETPSPEAPRGRRRPEA